MARDGSGNYTRVSGPYVGGTTISKDAVNDEFDDIATALSDSLNKAGTKALAANLPAGGFKLTGLAAGSSNGDSVRYEQLTGLSATYQPLDALLTAIAALTTADDRMLDLTGPDTVAVVTYATVLSNIAALPLAGGTLTGALIAAAGSVSAPSIALGDSGTGFYRVGSNNPAMAINGSKRIDFASAIIEVSTADLRMAMNPAALSTNSVGPRGAYYISGLKTDNYTLALQDSAQTVVFFISSGKNLTIPPNSDVAFPLGTVILVDNYYTTSANLSIVEGSGVTLRRMDATSGSGTRTVAPSASIALKKMETNVWQITGAFT